MRDLATEFLQASSFLMVKFYPTAPAASINSSFAEKTGVFLDEKRIHDSSFAEQPQRRRLIARVRRALSSAAYLG
jgi:hypothetical protein